MDQPGDDNAGTVHTTGRNGGIPADDAGFEACSDRLFEAYQRHKKAKEAQDQFIAQQGAASEEHKAKVAACLYDWHAAIVAWSEAREGLRCGEKVHGVDSEKAPEVSG